MGRRATRSGHRACEGLKQIFHSKFKLNFPVRALSDGLREISRMKTSAYVISQFREMHHIGIDFPAPAPQPARYVVIRGGAGGTPR
jgi:hypothetical protein